MIADFHSPNPALVQHHNQIDARELDQFDHVIYLLPKMYSNITWQTFTYGNVLKTRFEILKKKEPDTWSTQLPNVRGTHACIIHYDKNKTVFERLKQAREAIKLWPEKPSHPVIIFSADDDATEYSFLEPVIAALLANATQMPNFKSKKESVKPLSKIDLYGVSTRHDFTDTFATNEANALTRHLTHLPANILTPGHYRDALKIMAKTESWQYKCYDYKTLTKMGAGAFLAVAQGSQNKDACIVHLRYDPQKNTKETGLCLVGKGICFDTGGINTKAAEHMQHMHIDMQGSATAVATFRMLAKQKVSYAIDCFVALSENQGGNEAYFPSQVVTALNGKTIQIVHTDAEGRMILADTLHLASKNKPKLMIDFATLTGASIRALSHRYASVLSNDTTLYPTLTEAGQNSGERVWPFPMDADYKDAIKSDIADLKQCDIAGHADQILATQFLNEFVPKEIPWVHVDLSTSIAEGGLGHIDTMFTGFGSRFAMAFLKEQPNSNY